MPPEPFLKRMFLDSNCFFFLLYERQKRIVSIPLGLTDLFLVLRPDPEITYKHKVSLDLFSTYIYTYCREKLGQSNSDTDAIGKSID